MRNFKEVKDIASKLTVLEEIKEPLQGILGEINTLLYKGTSWIEQKESQSYKEIKELLEKKTTDFIRRCFVIANNGSERCSQVNEERSRAASFLSLDQTNISLKDESEYRVVIRKLNDLTTNVTSNTEVIQSLQQKIKDHEKLLKQVSSLQTNKYGNEEGMKELTAGGNFLSNIQSPKEPLSDVNYQCSYEKDIALRAPERMEKRVLLDKDNENLENLKLEIKRLTDELVYSKETVSSREFEITALKEEIERINERSQQLQEILGEMKEERGTGLVNERLEQCYNTMDKKNDEIGILELQLKQLNDSIEHIKKERDSAIEMLKVCKDKFQLMKSYIADTTIDYSMPVDVRTLKCGHDTKGFETYICQQKNCICLDCWRQTFLSFIPEIAD